ncbi:hypothetical protein PIB30_033367 [Stylosanthes scabra]|uniref:TIR domain-containing protein n=1 Tax=Stylosanthes scabra TaxID=79078 RepID=A0ABU6YEW8_9FABA|nr:hypothetical protein [Stylosanthes scabra]
MASSSSSNVHVIKHDVFISFRGEDVRPSFLSHLRKELRRNQIDFFVDDEKLHPGDEISSTLVRAIEQSYISLIIFSEHYASSRWCMEELVKIIECKEQHQRSVIPVFYKVDPSDVRHQRRTFAAAFDVHQGNYHEEIIQNWRSVLKEAANLSGIHYPSKYWDESELTEEIVKNISQKLSQLFSYASEGLIGIDENFKHIQSLLKIESNEIQILGIWGMGGIGKTTLAKAVFDRYSSQYDGCCFLKNVREESQKSSLHCLYERLISELLDEGEHLLVKGPAQARSMYVKRRLSWKKVLIVLDDVDTLDKLDYLAREQICLGAGSRIIVTTRDKQILIAAGAHGIYKVQGLSFGSSLELFCLKAFHKRYPNKGYGKLSEMAVDYANGIPLALKVLGSFLCSRSAVAWESALRKLKMHPDPSIFNVLKLSYDGLDDSEKNIFLDIDFFFKGEDKDNVIRFLDSCDFFGGIGIDNLQRKALVAISNNRIEMHDLIQQMAWEIVWQESNKDPGKLSRISRPEEFYNLLKNTQGKNAVEGIMIDLSHTKDLYLSANTFRNMPRLRFLKLYSSSDQRSSNVFVPTTLETFGDELRYFEWHEYPLSSMPSAFCAEMLVEFRMPGSKVSKLWDGVQDLVNLKIIDLWGCKQLAELPDLSKATNLEKIDISYCEDLCKLHPSILSIPKLKKLSLFSCKELKSFEGEIHSKSLKVLDFEGCSRLKEFSVSSGKLHSLLFSYSRIRSLPNGLCFFKCLEVLEFYKCRELIELPDNIKALSRLEILRVIGCNSLRSIPELPPSIKDLYADECTSLETIFSLKEVFSLNRRRISFGNCMRLDEESLNDIMEDTCFTIFTNILLTAAQTYNLSRDSYDHYLRCHAFYPGSNVAEWLRCQTAEGASKTVEIDQPYQHLLGFCFCCVLSPMFSPYDYIHCECRVGNRAKYTYGIYELNSEVERFSSDHVFLWFHPDHNRDILRAVKRGIVHHDDGITCNQTISFTFFVEGFSSVEDILIKGCGVFPIYASDVLHLIPKLELELKGLHPDLDLDTLESNLIQKINEKSILLELDSSSDQEGEEENEVLLEFDSSSDQEEEEEEEE